MLLPIIGPTYKKVISETEKLKRKIENKIKNTCFVVVYVAICMIIGQHAATMIYPLKFVSAAQNDNYVCYQNKIKNNKTK